eukprot:COSAG03_NODE_2722_length_2497_cov_3.186822_1_plen_704_part_10
MRRAALLLAAAQAAASATSVLDDDPLRRCPPATVTATDVALVVAGGRPNPELWRSVQSQVAAWLLPGTRQDVRVAVVQHSVAGGLELLTAPDAGGFARTPAEIDEVRWEQFRRAPSAAPRQPGAGPWRRTQPSVVADADAVAGLRAAAAVLGALAPAPNASSPLAPRDFGMVAIRVIVLVAAATSDMLADSQPTPARLRLSQQVATLQESMQVDFVAAEAAVSAVRASAVTLRRELIRGLKLTAATSASSSLGNAEVDVLRVGFILDGRGHAAVLRRALYGERSVEDSYRDGREGGMGITYHHARESCHKSWQPLCGKGGSLQGRLLRDGTGVRITEHNSSTLAPAGGDNGRCGEKWLGTPLQWLVAMPQLLLPPCDPRYPWALPRRPLLTHADDDGADNSNHGSHSGSHRGNHSGSHSGSHSVSIKDGAGGQDTIGPCQLHPTGLHTAAQRNSKVQMDAAARAAARLDGVTDAEQLQKMFDRTAADDEWQRGNGSGRLPDSPHTAAAAAADAGWAQQLERMACGSLHSSDPLLEAEPLPASASADSTARPTNTTGSVVVVNWPVQSEGSGGFTEWAVEQGVPLLLKGTPLAQWVAARTSRATVSASADATAEELNSWSWSALERRLADYPMVEAKRSSASTTGPHGALSLSLCLSVCLSVCVWGGGGGGGGAGFVFFFASLGFSLCGFLSFSFFPSVFSFYFG